MMMHNFYQFHLPADEWRRRRAGLGDDVRPPDANTREEERGRVSGKGGNGDEDDDDDEGDDMAWR